MSLFYEINSLTGRYVIIVLLAAALPCCTKEKPGPAPTEWQNTFTPILENNNQRDTVSDDEYITFSTDNTPSDRYIWYWGDGSKTDTTQTIFAIHQFGRTGLSIVKLRVERGNTYGENTDSVYVIHRQIVHCGFRIDCDDSLYVQNISHFVANISTPDCQSTCNFDYQWDFGDGNTGTGYHATHSFSTTGIYPVKVRVTRCSGTDTTIQKHVIVTGNQDTISYKCRCSYLPGGNSFQDTIHTQNLPGNPIKADGRILRRSGNINRYTGEYNCSPNGCETYILEVFNSLDSVDYSVKLPPFVEYRCSGRRLHE